MTHLCSPHGAHRCTLWAGTRVDQRRFRKKLEYGRVDPGRRDPQLPGASHTFWIFRDVEDCRRYAGFRVVRVVHLVVAGSLVVVSSTEAQILFRTNDGCDYALREGRKRGSVL
jgi:hypothetical protein